MSLDRNDVEELYRKFGPLVQRRARSILGNDDEARDAMQEVFVRAITCIAEFRGQSQPSTWLYRITTNLCLNRIRDGKRRRDRLREVGIARDAAGGATSLPDHVSTVTLRNLLKQLPEELGTIAIYYYVDEMDQDEIAALLGVSRRTVGYRLDQFRERARALLGEV